MNTNPNVKRILCFGDSNLWGRIPGDVNTARFPANKRWTGVLQNSLGNNFEVIEEGLNGRTTDKESPFKEGKNGAKYLLSCIESQNPLDMVILSLGKNDLKAQYNETAKSTGEGMRECVEVVIKEGKDKNENAPKILLMIPAVIEEKERVRFGKKVVDFLGAKDKSLELMGIYKKIAEEYNLYVFDVNDFIKVSNTDGVHLDEGSHKKLGQALYKKLKDIV
jgi:lysophospholipase L1-like esterase